MPSGFLSRWLLLPSCGLLPFVCLSSVGHPFCFPLPAFLLSASVPRAVRWRPERCPLPSACLLLSVGLLSFWLPDWCWLDGWMPSAAVRRESLRRPTLLVGRSQLNEKTQGDAVILQQLATLKPSSL
jgi:hypothetical protein